MTRFHVMLDLETLASDIHAKVVSVGAVKFNLKNDKIETFYKVFYDADTQQYSRTTSLETIRDFWLKLPAEVAAVGLYTRSFYNSESGISTEDGLIALNRFINNSYVWGNGSTFDNSIIRDIMKMYGVVPKWPFRKDMCFRTLKNLFPIDRISREGLNAHNALDDALYQVKWFKEIVSKHNLELTL